MDKKEQFVILTRGKYDQLVKAYDKYEVKKEQSRILMKKKYHLKKLQELEDPDRDSF